MKQRGESFGKRHSHPGDEARKPRQIPKEGWKQILLRVKDQLKYDHVQVVSAGVAFYFFMALFPTLAAFVAVYGLVIDTATVQEHMISLASFLPAEATELVREILESIVSESEGSLSLSLAVSILLSLWSANKGTSALFEGINIAYDEVDNRGFFTKNGLTLMVTFGGIILGSLAVGVVVGFPALTGNFDLSPFWELIVGLIRWPILAALIMLALAVVYKIGPDRDQPRFIWVSWGAIVATVLWLIGSLLFSLYVNNFGNYSNAYGSFAAVIIMLLWFYLTAFIILTGAEINSEMEHQTELDTTVGEPEPKGERGAFHADNGVEDTSEEDRKQ